LAAILGDDDPMQALIDAMGYASLPTYMYGGDGSGAPVEIGGSGYDLTGTGTTYENESAELSGYTTIFNADGDAVYNSTDAALQMGTRSFAALWLGYQDSDFGTTRTFFSDHDGTTGWKMQNNSAGRFTALLNSASGQKIILLSGHSDDEVHSNLMTVNNTTAVMNLHTKAGTGTVGSLYGESLNPASPKFSIGDAGGVARSFFGFWGIGAIWHDAAAEGLLATHNDALLTFMGAA
jgi:hypothetical protein